MVFTGQYLEEDQESCVEDTEEPHCPGTEVPEGLVGRIKDTVRSSRSSGPPGPEQTRPPAPGPCACFGRRSVTLRPFWLPEPQLLLTSGLLRPGVSDLGLRPSCAHIYGGRVPVKQRLEHPKPVVGRESGCYKRRVRPAPCG